MFALILAAALTQDPAEAATAPPAVYVKPDADLGVPLNDNATVYLDAPGGRLWLKTVVVQRTAPLEMFLCRRGSKDHETIVAVESPAFVIHGGLVALGIEPGTPATFAPDETDDDPPRFIPPTGPKLDLVVHWSQDGEMKTADASDWIRTVTRRWFTTPLAAEAGKDIPLPEDLDVRYDAAYEELLFFGTLTDDVRDRLKKLSDDPAFAKALNEIHEKSQPAGMDTDWVFTGSQFVTDSRTGERRYLAEGGTFVCTANFGEAMIDVAERSSASGESLLYEPWEERVPPLGTPVLLEIRRAAKERDASATDGPARPSTIADRPADPKADDDPNPAD